MALVNDVKREINAKIVYVGPRGAGKSTALRYIYGKLKAEYRSELKSTPLGEHQLLFFDFTYPQSVRSGGYAVRFHLYTIHGESDSPLPWKMLLKGADGLVFVADSDPQKLEENIASSAQLCEALAHYGKKPGDIPVSFQGNKRDLPHPLPLARLVEETFPELGASAIGVTAAKGEGVLEGLQRVVRAVLHNLGQGELPEEVGGEERPLDERAVASHQLVVGQDVDAAGLRVSPAGEPVMLDSGVLSVPLRLLDSGGNCMAEFKLGISITN